MTPIAHTAVGLLGWHKCAARRSWKTLIIFILIANLPDIDFLLRLFPGLHDQKVHQVYTHNVVFVFLSVLVFSIFLKEIKERIGLVLVAVSHLLMDIVMIDRVPPIGIRLLYPFSDQLFNIGLFPNVQRGKETIISFHNMVTVLLELMIFFLPVLIYLIKTTGFGFKRKENQHGKC